MRKIVENTVTSDQAEELIALLGTRHIGRDAFIANETVMSVLSAVGLSEDDIQDNSYWSIERAPKGHQWHVDTGSSNHMPWCKYGTSTLLTDDFSGGEFWYRDDSEPVDQKLYSTVMHASDVVHKVEPHSGRRIVLLAFL